MAKHNFLQKLQQICELTKKESTKTIKKPKINRFYKIGTFLFLKQNVNNRKKTNGGYSARGGAI